MIEIKSASELGQEIAKATEKSILSQLNDFISRGLIEVKMSELTFVRDDASGNRVRVEQSCQLVLKDKEYIEKLEKENRELREILMRLRAAM